jgi:hypothetical protein
MYDIYIYIDIYKGAAISSDCTVSNCTMIIKGTCKDVVTSKNFPGSTYQYYENIGQDSWYWDGVLNLRPP